ncbi:TPA: WGR domain-containing protein [Streptococcus pyogenes]|nr:WGR domain-containing protein [Streptococcus pyogenes]
MQLDLFPDTVHLQSVDPSRNRARFYAMAVMRDLFGAWVLVRRWGRIGTSGRSATTVFSSSAEALAALEETARAKARRGYGRQEA